MVSHTERHADLFCLLGCRVGWYYGALNGVVLVGVLIDKSASRLAQHGSDNVRQGAARHLLPVPLRYEGERNIAGL